MPDDLTPFEAEVLLQCQTLHAAGQNLRLVDLAKRMNVDPANYRLGKARSRLKRLGLLAFLRPSKPRALKPSTGYVYTGRGASNPKPKNVPKLEPGHEATAKPEPHGFAADVRAYNAAMKRLRAPVRVPEQGEEQTS
jgi:hypothetical protein